MPHDTDIWQIFPLETDTVDASFHRFGLEGKLTRTLSQMQNNSCVQDGPLVARAGDEHQRMISCDPQEGEA